MKLFLQSSSIWWIFYSLWINSFVYYIILDVLWWPGQVWGIIWWWRCSEEYRGMCMGNLYVCMYACTYVYVHKYVCNYVSILNFCIKFLIQNIWTPANLWEFLVTELHRHISKFCNTFSALSAKYDQLFCQRVILYVQCG